MDGIENYWGFLAAAVILNLTPGADTVYILMRSIAQGRKAGVWSAAGICAGILVHVLLVSFGLAQVVAHSPLLFSLLQYGGALYLLYLGVKMWRTPPAEWDGVADMPAGRRLFVQGLLTNLLNPKIVLFFLALLPQFVVPSAAASAAPFLVLGLTFLATSLLWCLLLAVSGAPAGRLLRRFPLLARWMNRISGMVFIGLGVRLGLVR
ncbi:LysE family translocator [Neisseria leonii]|uniref:LysE family translocator n=1 Tax=Neisseria leonii TaxID=2995413 RepID=A0A9X4E0R9_9NEIS|nr:LysE family translocator [Neisseria sp. 51.81]MDD9327291.1 LysE family translocator [Neisseria sp. 51.81]